MSYMFEVYYNAPINNELEDRILKEVRDYGGWFDYRDLPSLALNAIILSYEFDNLEMAERAAIHLQGLGYYVEGPVDYGGD